MKLNELIIGLSQSEKRYFSRLSSFQKLGKTKYMKLFLSYKKGAQENTIVKNFGADYSAQLKQQLKNKVLESLRIFHRKSIPYNSENQLLENAFLLKTRGYWSEAKKTLQRVKKKSINCGTSMTCYSEMAFIESRLSKKGIEQLLENWDSEVESKLSLQRIILQMDRKYLEISLLNKEIESARKPIHKKLLNHYVSNLEELKKKSNFSDYSLLYYHYNFGLSNYLLGNIEISYRAYNTICQQVDSDGYLLNLRGDLILRSMANRVLCAIGLGKLSLAKTHIKELEKIPIFSSFYASYKAYIINVLELMIYSKTENYMDGIKTVEGFQNQRKDFVSTIEEETFIYQEQIYETFHYANCLYKSGSIKKAIRIMFEFISLKKNIAKKDAYSAARFFYLVLLIELNDDELVYAELRSVERFLKQQELYFGVEKILSNFVKGLMIKNTSFQIRSYYKSLVKDLEKLNEDPFERNAFTYFDFLAWAKQKSK
ncbi:MAG: hypothetical protein CL853_01275 [Crocinitomicaceae bacterium]|nr:hypothetical protein [Crocinitomicaceae bacterium]|tara:strand:+ start:6815 stop:8269 length:1455 start_codon:yes stop_codon:yes gene_type:complete